MSELTMNVNRLAVGVGTGIVHKSLDLNGRRRKSQQVETQPTDQHGAVGGHGPGAVVGLDQHGAAGAVQQLCAAVAVAGQQIAGGIVRADGEHVDGEVVDVVQRDVAHAPRVWRTLERIRQRLACPPWGW